MAAGKYNFTLEQGATFSREITVQDSGSPMNLTGHTPRMQMRSTHDSSTIALTFTASVSNAAQGKIQLSASATNTAAVEEGMYVYDLEIESGSSGVTRLLEGQVTVTPEVTR
jgi:hypothetical protein|tara:strand:- start:1098 stop:1433 length:336 start_codon:yes stop_codon:yes gene_type:complete